MIIVSQDKKKIINFDLVQSLEINTPEDWNQGFYSIDTYPNTSDAQRFHIRLGKYSTEEKAKKVLKEITKVYNYANGDVCTIGEARELLGKYYRKVYEMPEE